MIQSQSLRYFLYARKSSESEDRQMASIEDQIKEVTKIADELGLTIVKVYSESKSAKAPGRSVFNEMLLALEKGKADGILCWKLNRLARNPVDGGKISWMLQQNIIKHIQCYGRDYKPSDNVLMMQVELGMANQFIKDLSIDIKRGIRQKAERGWYPASLLPIGYVHNKGDENKLTEIIPDNKTFPLIKKLWKLILTGNYSITDIHKKAKSIGIDETILSSKTSFYNLFRKEFYCGYFYWKDESGIKKRYKGKHKPMISEKEFQRVQKILDNNSSDTRPKVYDYPYRGFIKCGECGCGITAERKKQAICTKCKTKFSCLHKQECSKCGTLISQMNNPTITDTTYYRCTKRKGRCSQKFLRKEDLEYQIFEVLKNIALPKDFYSLLVYELKEFNNTDSEQTQRISFLKKQITELNNRISKLTLMRADNEISSEEFQRIKNDSVLKIKEFEKEVGSILYLSEQWITIANDYLSLTQNVIKIFKNGDNFVKKSILQKIGSNLTILDRKLYFSTLKPMQLIIDGYKLYTQEKRRFEPKNRLVKQSDLGGFDTSNTVWWTFLQEVRTSIVESQ